VLPLVEGALGGSTLLFSTEDFGFLGTG
jgi:hypothetical protein